LVSDDSIALDTSVAIAVLAGQASTLLSQPAREFLLPVLVVGELRYGALSSRRSAENLAEVERLVARCRVLDVTAVTAAAYARLRLGLKEKGKPIPENDLWIAALCVEHRLPLATLDTTSTRSMDSIAYACKEDLLSLKPFDSEREVASVKAAGISTPPGTPCPNLL
jgi:tRNA(fMet)-specific endonuclease VapC